MSGELLTMVVAVVALGAIVFVRAGVGPVFRAAIKVAAALGLFRLYRAAINAAHEGSRTRW